MAVQEHLCLKDPPPRSWPLRGLIMLGRDAITAIESLCMMGRCNKGDIEVLLRTKCWPWNRGITGRWNGDGKIEIN
jgi:hypothetical protein